MERIDYMLVKLLCLVLLSIWNCNGNITTCNESVESKVCFLVNKVKNLCFSPLTFRLWLKLRLQQSLFTTSKTDRHLLRQKACQRISVVIPENRNFNSLFVLTTAKTPVFVFITEILWQTVWRNNWRSVSDIVKILYFCMDRNQSDQFCCTFHS